jgi:hypothetical protein
MNFFLITLKNTKMKKLIIVLPAMALIMSCSKDTDKPAPTQPMQDIIVKVLDYNSGASLDSASVASYPSIVSNGTTRQIKHLGYTNQEGMVNLKADTGVKIQVSRHGYYVQTQDDQPAFKKNDHQYTFFLLPVDVINISVEVKNSEPNANQVFSFKVTGIMRDSSLREISAVNDWIQLRAGGQSVPLKIIKGVENRINIMDRDGKVVKSATIAANRTADTLAIEI